MLTINSSWPAVTLFLSFNALVVNPALIKSQNYVTDKNFYCSNSLPKIVFLTWFIVRSMVVLKHYCVCLVRGEASLTWSDYLSTFREPCSCFHKTKYLMFVVCFTAVQFSELSFRKKKSENNIWLVIEYCPNTRDGTTHKLSSWSRLTFKNDVILLQVRESVAKALKESI